MRRYMQLTRRFPSDKENDEAQLSLFNIHFLLLSYVIIKVRYRTEIKDIKCLEFKFRVSLFLCGCNVTRAVHSMFIESFSFPGTEFKKSIRISGFGAGFHTEMVDFSHFFKFYI